MKNYYLHAVVAIFDNIDLDKDSIEKGAFLKSLAGWKKRGKWPTGVFSHDLKQPIARTLLVWEEKDGLHILGCLNGETQRGKEVISDLKAGILTEFSIGYQVKRSDIKQGIRRLIELELLEWSPVVLGANPGTYIVAQGDWAEISSSFRKHLAGSCLRNELEVLESILEDNR